MGEAELEINLRGIPQVLFAGDNVKLTRKGMALLAYVVLEGKTPREKIADLLWGELGEDGANRNLRRELHRLRETPIFAHLETEGAIGLHSYSTNANSSKNELLQGLILTDAPQFMDWLNNQRNQQHQQYLSHLRLTALNTLNLEQRVLIQQEIFTLEPMSESDASALMVTLINLKRTDEATRVYTELTKQLQTIAAKPSAETTQLLEQKNTFESYLEAARAAQENQLPLEALVYFTSALELQKKPQERFLTHQERLNLILATGQFELYPQELSALLESVKGDAQLEARALVIKSGIEFQQLQFANSLESATLALENPLLQKEEQGIAHYYTGVSLLRLGQLVKAEPHLHQALELLSQNAGTERTKVHHGLSQLALQRNDLPEANKHNTAAAELVSQSQDRAMRGNVLSVSGILAMVQGQYDKAMRLLETAKRECQQSQNMAAIPMIMANMAKAQIELGQLPEAIESLEQGLSAARTTGNRTMEGQLLNSLAITHQERGNLGIALETYSAALEFARNIQDARGMAFRHLSHVDLLVQLGDTKEAAHHLEQARIIIGDNTPDLQDWWKIQKSEWHILQNQHSEAQLLLEPLQNHTEIEIRLNAQYLLAKSQTQQNKVTDTLLEHQNNPKWSIKVLTLYPHLTPEQQALARANLHKIGALDQLRLLRALSEPSTELEQNLIQSLEDHPQIQECFKAHILLETRLPVL